MTKKIHNAILIVSLVIFLCCVFVIMGISYPYFNEQLEAEIESEASFLAAGVELSGTEYLEKINTEHRITLLDKEGNVLYDTNAKASDMESHRDRDEFIQAVAEGQGESYRYSGTLTQKTYYFALRLSDGNVLRVSDVQMTVGAVLARMLLPISAAFIVVLAVSAILSHSLAKRIVKPINELDFDNPRIAEDYVELTPMIRKISRQKRLIRLQMDDLTKKQEEFLTITQNMSEGLILIGAKSEILSYNKSALRLFGADKTELGTSVLTFSADESFADAVSSVLDGKKCRPLVEVNGRTLQIFANPVMVKDSISGAVLLIIDVTEKEQRDSMRREFTSNVSHELKTPLTSIYGISDMMMNGIVKPDDMQGFAKNIHDESGRLITLVNDIIKLSQLDESSPTLEKCRLDLLSLANEAVGRLSLVAQEKNISISASGESTEIEGIPSVVSEMIYNLCDNAIKYNRECGRVDITVGKRGDRPFFSVKDTGIGIPKEHLDRVFERFYRVDKSHSRKIGGTGLGLSIVKHGALVHNAKVKLESREGEGTTVTVTF